MNTAGRLYILSAAIALVAMANRAGWIDWPVIGHVVVVGLTVSAWVAAFLVLMAVVVGIPMTLAGVAITSVLRLVPEKRTEASSP